MKRLKMTKIEQEIQLALLLLIISKFQIKTELFLLIKVLQKMIKQLLLLSGNIFIHWPIKKVLIGIIIVKNLNMVEINF